jgi:hypothetical protein
VTEIETSAAFVTFRVVVPVTEPEVALMLVVPVATLVASPLVLAVLLIVAIEGDAELHTTVDVKFCVLWSE